MKNVLLMTIMLLNATYTMAQADYPAAVSKFQRYYTAKQSDSLFNMFSATMKAALPLDKTIATMEALHTQLGEIKSITPLTTEAAQVIYKATFTNTICKLILALNNDNLLEGLRLVPYEDIKAVVKDTDNVILNGIHGTLTVPDGNKKIPMVLLIAGSGPTDRLSLNVHQISNPVVIDRLAVWKSSATVKKIVGDLQKLVSKTNTSL